MWRKASLIIQSIFYFVAGANHFINPDFYLPLIPDYLPEKSIINVLAGVIEIVLALALLSEKYQRPAAISLIIMLIAFIPSHIYFIQIGSCISEGLCVSPTVAWLRLLLIHPLLIWWSYSVRNTVIQPLWGN